MAKHERHPGRRHNGGKQAAAIDGSMGGSGGGKPGFREAAALHYTSNLYQTNYVAGQTVTLSVNRTGYLNKIRLQVNPVVTVGTADAGSDLPDYGSLLNILPLIAFKSPQGDYIHSYDSRSLLEFAHRLQPVIKPSTIKGETVVGTADPQFVGINVASATAQTCLFNLQMPFAINNGLNFETGQILRQISNNDFQLIIRFAAPSDLYGTSTLAGTGGHFTITTITGSIVVEECWYEAVDPNMVEPPDFSTMIKLRTQQFNGIAIGDNYLAYSVGPVLMDQILRIVTNNAADASYGANFTYIKVIANKQTELQNRRGLDVVYDNFEHLLKRFPPGVFHLDFNDDSDYVNVTRARDWINSNLASQLDTVVNIASGTTLSNPLINSFYRELETLGA